MDIRGKKEKREREEIMNENFQNTTEAVCGFFIETRGKPHFLHRLIKPKSELLSQAQELKTYSQ